MPRGARIEPPAAEAHHDRVAFAQQRSGEVGMAASGQRRSTVAGSTGQHRPRHIENPHIELGEHAGQAANPAANWYM
jgi:hypothetical protein